LHAADRLSLQDYDHFSRRHTSRRQPISV